MMIFIQYKCRLQFFANCLLFHYVSSVFSTTDKIDMPDIAGKFSRYKPMKCRRIIYKLKPINESYAPYILLNTHVTRNMNMLCSFTDFLWLLQNFFAFLARGKRKKVCTPAIGIDKVWTRRFFAVIASLTGIVQVNRSFLISPNLCLVYQAR